MRGNKIHELGLDMIVLGLPCIYKRGHKRPIIRNVFLILVLPYLFRRDQDLTAWCNFVYSRTFLFFFFF